MKFSIPPYIACGWIEMLLPLPFFTRKWNETNALFHPVIVQEHVSMYAMYYMLIIFVCKSEHFHILHKPIQMNGGKTVCAWFRSFLWLSTRLYQYVYKWMVGIGMRSFIYGEWRTQNERESKLWNMEKLKVKVHSQVFVLNLMIYFLVSGNNLKNVIDWLG